MAETAPIEAQVALLKTLADSLTDAAVIAALEAAIVALQTATPHRPLPGRRPKWWSDQPVRELVIASYREKRLDEVVADATAQFGAARAPSRSSVGRVWQRIDRGHLIKGAW